MRYKISDIADINKQTLKKNHSLKQIRYLDTSNLTEGKIESLSLLEVGVDKIPSRAKRLVEENDILISTVRPNQKHYGLLKNTEKNLVVSTGFAVLTPNTKVVDQHYLYALLTLDSTTEHLQMIAENSTSAYPSIKPSVVGELEFDFPTLEVQIEIGKIFQKLLDKIELNNQLIRTLEEIAATLFKHWFVDFEFPDENGNPYKSSEGKMVESELGEMPSAWRIAPLSEVGDIIAGGTPSKKIADYYEEGTIPWITPKDLSNNKCTFISEGATNITKLGLDKSSAKLLPEYSVLFSSRAPIGYVAINKNPVSTNQGFKSVVPNENIPYQFIYFYLKNNTSYIESIAGGSTFKEISGKAMKELSVILPTQDLLDQFRLTTQPIFDGIKNLEESNDTLTKLRDTLLPKLLSGEIELPMEEEVRV